MKFYVIGDADTVLGFSLVGIKGEVVQTPEETGDALKKAFENEDLGVVIITERLAQQVRVLVDQYIYKTTFPLIIEIQDRHGPMQGRGDVRDMIRSAVGISL